MATDTETDDATPDVGRIAGQAVLSIRLALRWSQRRLGSAAGVDQATISRIERGLAPDVPLATIDGVLRAMGARLLLDIRRPDRVALRGLRDPVHARMSAAVVRRLVRAGYQVETEVEIGSVNSRGWIDILAFHPATGLLLVIELKSEIRDLGAIERQLGWYEREARAAARRLGWLPAHVVGCLLVLMSTANDETIRFHADSLRRTFPVRATALAAMAIGADPGAAPIRSRGRSIAMIDPRSRRRQWLRPTAVDGRRTAAPYADYRSALQQMERHRRGAPPGPRRKPSRDA
jgi:transcriptional regulator with XRE-family HTH domain